MLRSALLNVMIKAARKASRTLKRDFGEIEHLQTSLKGPANFVTAADRHAEEILREELEHARPGYGFLGEEGGAREGSDKTHRWIVDPLDGTLNFLHGIPHFAISIGLEREGTMVAGVVYNPANDELFTAERRQGRLSQRSAVAGGGTQAARRRSRRLRTAASQPRRRGTRAQRAYRDAGASRRTAAVRSRRARPRLGGGRPPRWLLGAEPLAVGHGGGYRAGARSRRFITDLDGREEMIKPAASSRATRTFTARCCGRSRRRKRRHRSPSGPRPERVDRGFGGVRPAALLLPSAAAVPYCESR